MATVAVPRRATVDGATVEDEVEVEVSPEVLKLLRKPDRKPREKSFTDLGVKAATGEASGAVPDAADPDEVPKATGRGRGSHGAHRKGYGVVLKPGAWEGPRFTFNLFLGEGRVGWSALPYLDELGRCGDCHGRKLGQGTYCLGCNRCGKELELPTVPMRPEVRAFAECVGAWRQDVREHGSAAKAARAARVAAGEPEPEKRPLGLAGGLGTKPRKPNQRKQKATRKGTGVNSFDLVALKLQNTIGKGG